MRFRIKPLPNLATKSKFAWLPVRTEDGYIVWLDEVNAVWHDDPESNWASDESHWKYYAWDQA